MGSIVDEKFQLVMQRFHSIILLFVACFFLSGQEVLGQCPAGAVIDNPGLDNSGVVEILVYDSFNDGLDITDFEVNIYNEATGIYLVTESKNFPVINNNYDISINKQGNSLRLSGITEDVDLLRCVVIFMGEECPVKKVNLTER